MTGKSGRVFRFFSALARNYPFTFSGTVLFAVSVYLLGRGFAASNLTAISVAFFFLVFVLSLWLYLFFASRAAGIERVVWKAEGDIDSTGSASNRQIVNLTGSSAVILPPVFTRFILLIHGRAKTSGGVRPRFFSRHRSDSKGFFDFSFNFPYPGTVSGSIEVYTGDIFSLARVRVFSEKLKDFPVLPGPDPEAGTDFRHLIKDLVTRHRKHDNDTEKYLMREYVPGDLYRDINWKSSGRIDKLVTRISPGGREEADIYTFLYLSSGESGDKNSDCYGSFITGKYFSEYFRTFVQRAKAEADRAGKCEFHIIVDGVKCIAREMKDFTSAFSLMALSCSAEPKQKHDLSFLSEIPQGSSLCIFAESPEILRAALEKLTAERISACYLPEAVPGHVYAGRDYIRMRSGSFIFSSFYSPFRFYSGFASHAVNTIFSRLRVSGKTRGKSQDFVSRSISVKKVAILAASFPGFSRGSRLSGADRHEQQKR